MNRNITNLSWLLAGAGLMYLLDPRQGPRRRAMVRDRTVKEIHKSEGALEVGAKDLSHRTKGFFLELLSNLKRFRETVDDDVLVARVRSKLGRVTSHPSAIEVAAENGCVELSGPILASEEHRVLSGVKSVHGVKAISNCLTVQEAAGATPALQGRGREYRSRWSPATRLLLGSVFSSGLLGAAFYTRSKVMKRAA